MTAKFWMVVVVAVALPFASCYGAATSAEKVLGTHSVWVEPN